MRRLPAGCLVKEVCLNIMQGRIKQESRRPCRFRRFKLMRQSFVVASLGKVCC